jgi:hypothetical protein
VNSYRHALGKTKGHTKGWKTFCVALFDVESALSGGVRLIYVCARQFVCSPSIETPSLIE